MTKLTLKYQLCIQMQCYVMMKAFDKNEISTGKYQAELG